MVFEKTNLIKTCFPCVVEQRRMQVISYLLNKNNDFDFYNI